MGLALLLAGLAIGYWLWIRPHDDTLNFQSRGLLLLMLLTLMGGLVSATSSRFWWLLQSTLALGCRPSVSGNLVTGRALTVSYFVAFSLVSLVSILFLFVNYRKVPNQVS